MKLRKLILTEVEQLLLEKLIIYGNRAPYGQVLFMAGGAGCFTEDTLVETESGHKKISEILIGDKVWTLNEETKERELNEVIACYDWRVDELPERQELIELELEGGITIRCTENHEFYVDGEWVMAKDLQIGTDL